MVLGISNSPLKCDDCGKFVAYADLDSGKARHTLVTPDSDYSAETFDTTCARCTKKERTNVDRPHGGADQSL